MYLLSFKLEKRHFLIILLLILCLFPGLDSALGLLLILPLISSLTCPSFCFCSSPWSAPYPAPGLLLILLLILLLLFPLVRCILTDGGLLSRIISTSAGELNGWQWSLWLQPREILPPIVTLYFSIQDYFGSSISKLPLGTSHKKTVNHF